MKILLIIALVLTVLVWPLYRYANREGQPADDWSSAFPLMIDAVLAVACYAVWLVWALLHYLLT